MPDPGENRLRGLVILGATLLTAAWIVPVRAAATAGDMAGPVDFSRDVRPVLSENCFHCHGPDAGSRKAGLRLDTREGMLAGADGDTALVPGSHAKSPLWLRLTTKDPDEVMPPTKTNKHLTAAQVETIQRWIDEGATWTEHWAYTAPKRPALPTASRKGWVRNSIDHFVLQRLEKEGLSPAVEASRETLCRRVTLDLTGLPPTIEETEGFVRDRRKDAYERLVDRLLASPRYGEHMVLQWLEAARYSDSNGFQGDGARAMWPWRDWVVKALNSNMRFDQFTVEQIAGDLLPGATVEQKIATGFHRNHPLNGEGGAIAEESRAGYVADRTDTTATVWLGLTAGCARCHDHKYDPIKQKDYYQLYSYFDQVAESGDVDGHSNTALPVLELSPPKQIALRDTQQKAVATAKTALELVDKDLLAALPKWEATIESADLPADIREILGVPVDKRSVDQVRILNDHYLGASAVHRDRKREADAARSVLDRLNKAILVTMVMSDRAIPRQTHILIRGEYDKPGDEVQPAVPSWLPPLPVGAPANRLGLARWLVEPANPLTARVTVNRYWQVFFGAGLVRTPEDFGTQGEAPTHPALLDWLATEFVRTGWNVKAIHRLIVTSATYRQDSRVTPEGLERDPENRLLGRGARFRLDAHAIRDQALAVSGLLVEKVGGPPVKPYQPEGVWEDFSYGRITYQRDGGDSLYRRSLYTFWRRSVGPTSLFDKPGRQVCTVRVSRTNSPLHALTTLNDEAFVEAARVFSERLLARKRLSDKDRLSYAFRQATGRKPTAEENAILLRALARFHQHYLGNEVAAGALIHVGASPLRIAPSVSPVTLAAYTATTSLILNLDETLTKE